MPPLTNLDVQPVAISVKVGGASEPARQREPGIRFR